MTKASDLVDEVLIKQIYPDLPQEVAEILERHRKSLLNLAKSLLAAGRNQSEVIAIIETASSSFSTKLQNEIEEMKL